MSFEDWKESIYQQAMGGKKQWTAKETGGDPDRFTREILEPLEELEADGVLTITTKHEGSYRGRKAIDFVLIEPNEES